MDACPPRKIARLLPMETVVRKVWALLANSKYETRFQRAGFAKNVVD